MARLLKTNWKIFEEILKKYSFCLKNTYKWYLIDLILTEILLNWGIYMSKIPIIFQLNWFEARDYQRDETLQFSHRRHKYVRQHHCTSVPPINQRLDHEPKQIHTKNTCWKILFIPSIFGNSHNVSIEKQGRRRGKQTTFLLLFWKVRFVEMK